MKIAGRGTVFFGEAGTESSSACFPGVCALPGGRWVVTFRASPKKADAFPQHLMVTCSDDEGETWTKPVAPFSAPPVNGKPGVFRSGHPTALGGERLAAVLYWVDASDPSLPFFNEQTEGLLDSCIFAATSDDGGATWSEPWRIDTNPFNTPTPITGPILALPSGEWAVQFETNKTYYDTSMWHHASVLMISGDEGKTWPEYGVAAADPAARIFYWDQRPNVMADGSILNVFWTFDRREAVYLNMHACLSKDGGRTWSGLWDTGVPGQAGPPVQLADGRIALPYVDRERTPLIKLRVSADGARSWPDDTEVVLDDSSARAQQGKKATMQDAWTEMGKFSVGLPYSALLPGGDVLVVYYAGPQTNHTGVHWVRLRP